VNGARGSIDRVLCKVVNSECCVKKDNLRLPLSRARDICNVHVELQAATKGGRPLQALQGRLFTKHVRVGSDIKPAAPTFEGVWRICDDLQLSAERDASDLP
jgi:hypothetical protein